MPIKYNNFDIGNAYLGNDNLVAMYQGSNLVWTNGIKLQLKTHKTVDLGDLSYGYGGDSGDMVRVIYTGCDDRIPMTNATISQTDKLQYIDYGMGTGEELINKISTTTYSYFVYIGLSKRTIGWQVGDGDDLLQTKAQNYLRGIKFTYELNSKCIIKGTKYALAKFDEETFVYDTYAPSYIVRKSENWLNAFPKGADFSSGDGNFFAEVNGFVWSLWSNNSRIEMEFVKQNSTKEEVSSILNGTYIIYELDQPDGNTLDTLTAEQVYNLITLNGTDFTNLELLSAGYEIKLGSFNNLGKWGCYQFDGTETFTDVGQSGNFYRYYVQPTAYINNVKIATSGFGNILGFYSKLPTYEGAWGNQTNECIRLGQNNNAIYFYFSTAKTQQELKNFVKDTIVIYELQNSLGNELDNYTAEQVYYMFFATLGMSKMYVPYGKRFESSDNIILGTKYGIIDLGEPTWYKYTRGSNWIFYATIPNGKRYGDINGLNVDYWLNSSKWKINQKTNNGGGTASGEDLQVFWDASNSQLLIKDMSFTDGGGNIKNYLKGCYLVYPLAEPNGTDYNDLTAKQMYDMLNTNKIDVIADGKSVDGVRNIFGKFNNIPQIDFATYENTSDVYISKNGCDHSDMSKLEKLNVKLYDGHKYFIAIGFKNIPDNKKTELWNCLLLCDSNGDHITQDRYYIGCDNNVFYTITYATRNAICDYVRFYDNTSTVAKDELLPTFVVAVDLDENNIQIEPDGYEKTNKQKCYQYFKEHNLFKMTTTGEINIGGLKPKVVARKPTFTIEGTPYQFESGMTWLSWCSSSYNTANLVCEDIVHTSDYSYSLFNNDKSDKISSSAVIIENYEYKLS